MIVVLLYELEDCIIKVPLKYNKKIRIYNFKRNDKVGVNELTHIQDESCVQIAHSGGGCRCPCD